MLHTVKILQGFFKRAGGEPGSKPDRAGCHHIRDVVLSAQVDDDSVYPVPAVKHFLAEIGVPLVVWVAHKKTDNPWGPGTKTVSPKDFSRATDALLDELRDEIRSLPKISGLAIDLTSKPPGTIEWE